MGKKLIALGCGLVLLLAAGYFWQSLRPVESVYGVTKNLRYSFTVTNKTNEFIASSKFRVFAPIRLTATQRVLTITSSRSYSVLKDRLGNELLEFEIENLAPFASKTVSITLEMEFAETPNREDLINKEAYLTTERYVELESDAVKGVAITFQESKKVSQDIYKWLVQNVKYTGYVSEDRGAEYVINNRKGDCTEFMYGFVALSRLNMLPARSVGGFVVGPQKHLLNSSDYHNWAEFYDGDRWQLADPQRKVFENSDKHYIAFRYIGDEEGNPVGNTHRFMAFDPGLTIRMN